MVHMATKRGNDILGHQVPDRDLPQRLMASCFYPPGCTAANVFRKAGTDHVRLESGYAIFQASSDEPRTSPSDGQ